MTYMTKKIQRSYHLPEKLVPEWDKFHQKGQKKDHSAAGAFILWMSLDADIRELAIEFSRRNDISQGIKDLSVLLRQHIVKSESIRFFQSLSAEQIDLIRKDIESSGRKIVRKK